MWMIQRALITNNITDQFKFDQFQHCFYSQKEVPDLEDIGDVTAAVLLVRKFTPRVVG